MFLKKFLSHSCLFLTYLFPSAFTSVSFAPSNVKQNNYSPGFPNNSWKRECCPYSVLFVKD